MIHLDTNYLVGLLVRRSVQAQDVDGWLAAGRVLATSAIAWTEFLSGPVTALEVKEVEVVLSGGIIPFTDWEAVVAADLFNKTGRRRGSRLDCMIAATALRARAEVATANRDDFPVFQAHGLVLASPLPPPQPSALGDRAAGT